MTLTSDKANTFAGILLGLQKYDNSYDVKHITCLSTFINVLLKDISKWSQIHLHVHVHVHVHVDEG